MSECITQQVTRSHTIHVPAPPHEVFPLFSPLGEKLWAHGWDPEMLYPSSGVAQVGTVFTTQHTDKPPQIWTIIAYASEQTQVSYLTVVPGSHVSRIEVSCEAEGTGATLARITYTLTALTPQGNTYLDGFTQDYYQHYISSWETAITHYVLYGQTPVQTEAQA